MLISFLKLNRDPRHLFYGRTLLLSIAHWFRARWMHYLPEKSSHYPSLRIGLVDPCLLDVRLAVVVDQ